MTQTSTPAVGTLRRPDRRGGPAAARRRNTVVAYAFALPFLVIFAAFMLVPLLSSLAMSFTNFRATNIPAPLNVDVVGLQQYLSLFTNAQFQRSVLNTGYFVLVGIPLTMVVALALAVGLNRGLGRLSAVLRVGFYAPVVTTIVAVAVVWRFLLQPDGLVNQALLLVGISGPDWLNDPTWAMPALIAMAVWRNMGTLMVIFLAGLQAVPEDIIEAAEIDGANAWQRFTRIVVPSLRPTLLLGAVLLSVGYLQFFDEAFVMTQGGPLDSTLSVSYFTFNQFGFGNYATASAASYLLFAAIALLSLVQFRVFRSED